MFDESGWFNGFADPLEGVIHLVHQVFEHTATMIPQVFMFQRFPNQLLWVQLRCIRRQVSKLHDLLAFLALQELQDGVASVVPARVVPDHDHRLVEALTQMLEVLRHRGLVRRLDMHQVQLSVIRQRAHQLHPIRARRPEHSRRLTDATPGPMNVAKELAFGLVDEDQERVSLRCFFFSASGALVRPRFAWRLRWSRGAGEQAFARRNLAAS